MCQFGLSVSPTNTSPIFTGHPYSVQLGLSSGFSASDHPAHRHSVVKAAAQGAAYLVGGAEGEI